MERYRKENTYLVIDKKTNQYIRLQGDNKLFFAGSKEDALIGLPNDDVEAIRVCDCPIDVQKEYEQRIDECIENGEL
jgi:hypothetical protein